MIGIPNLCFCFVSVSYLFNGKQPPEAFYKKSVLRPATLLKKRLWYRCFPVNLANFLRTPFLQSTSGRLLLLDEHFRSKRQQRKVKDHSLFLSPNPKRSSALFTKRLQKITLLHECFFIFLNCTNGTKLRKASHMNLLIPEIIVFLIYFIEYCHSQCSNFKK